jgi:hypothetical protein
MWTGTSSSQLSRANHTYLNDLGPGAYNLPPLFGSNPIETRRRNMPYISFGQKTKPVYGKGFTKELMLSQSPNILYSPNYEFSSLKQSPSNATIGKTPKFFDPVRLRRERENRQYLTGSDSSLTISRSIEEIIGKQTPELITERSLNKSSVFSPTIGRSQRYDFTRVPQQIDFNNVGYYDPLKSISFASTVRKGIKIKKDFTTFGSPHTDSSLVSHRKQHYYGRGPGPNLAQPVFLQ